MASDSKGESSPTNPSADKMNKFNGEQLKPFLNSLIDISTDITNSNELSEENKLKIKLLQKLIPVFNQMVEAKTDDIEDVLGINLSDQSNEPDLYRTSQPGVFKTASGVREIEKPKPEVVETPEQVKKRLEDNVLINQFIRDNVERLKTLQNRGWCRVQSTETYFVNSVTKNVFKEPSDETNDETKGETKDEAKDETKDSTMTAVNETGIGAEAGTGPGADTGDVDPDLDLIGNDATDPSRDSTVEVDVDKIVAELIGDSGDDVPMLTRVGQVQAV